MTNRTLNNGNTLNFPSLNGQHTTVLSKAYKKQSVNTQDLNSFPALSLESESSPKPPKQVNNIKSAAILKESLEPCKFKRPNELDVGPTSSQLTNRARNFSSLYDIQQQNTAKEGKTASPIDNSSVSWVSKIKAASVSSNDAKKESVDVNRKISDTSRVIGSLDFLNLNKKLEPSKSNLAKLGNKTTNNIMKNRSLEKTNIQNGKNNDVQQQTALVNNSTREVDHELKTKLVKVQCNVENNIQTTTKTVTNTNNMKVVELKKEISPITLVPETSGTITSVINNQNGETNREKNENKELLEIETQAMVVNLKCSQDNNHLKSNSPKIPPGLNNMLYHEFRSPPGPNMTHKVVYSQPQAQNTIKSPPELSLNKYKQFEYLHPVCSTIRNKVLINNMMAALIPEYDGSFDTLERYMVMSELFHKYMITAYDFYSYCVKALSPDSFESIFQELVLLLPNIQKQQVYQLGYIQK